MSLLSVNYHYLREKKYKSGIYPLTKKEFLYQIDKISKFYEFISQNDLIEIIKNKNFLKKNFCILTFDDGLKEQMNALEWLNKKGIPGLFYVSTSSIQNNKVVSVHKLHYIQSVMENKEILKFINSRIDLKIIKYPNNIDQFYRYDDIDTKKLKYLFNFILDHNITNKLIGDLFKEIEDETQFSKKLYMDINDIKKIDNQDYLGTHCHSHLPLATLNNQEIEQDIQNSIFFLQKNCGVNKIKSISYPYGGPKAVSQKVVDISNKFRFHFGFTMIRGLNNYEDFHNPLLLKRVDTNDAPGGKLNSKEFLI